MRSFASRILDTTLTFTRPLSCHSMFRTPRSASASMDLHVRDLHLPAAGDLERGRPAVRAGEDILGVGDVELPAAGRALPSHGNDLYGERRVLRPGRLLQRVEGEGQGLRHHTGGAAQPHRDGVDRGAPLLGALFVNDL